MKYIIRIIGFPFFAVLSLIGILHQWIKLNINFIRFGGEAYSYTKKDRRLILDIYDELVKQREVNHP